MIREYIYIGDRFSSSEFKNQKCIAVINKKNDKCIRGKNGNMLVSFDGKAVIVIARLLRKVKNTP